MSSLLDYWYSPHPTRWLLTPFSGLFRLIIRLRRWSYACGLLHTQTLPVPVLMVGNLTLGGTGKTPLVIWLAQFLQRQGYRPGLVSRGYGGWAPNYPQWVSCNSDPGLVGDEALLLARCTACPVVVGPNRVAAAQALLAHANCDVLLSDDGLQHYALARDIEILVVDGIRRFGNGHCLPAGPLREPLSRLQTTALVVNTGSTHEGEYTMHVQLKKARNLKDRTQCPLASFRRTPIHAVAGIGHPNRFFIQLQKQGLIIYEHAFPDHHRFRPEDLAFRDNLPVLMTEKDGVKCARFACDKHWYVPINVTLPVPFGRQVLHLLQQISSIKNRVKK